MSNSNYPNDHIKMSNMLQTPFKFFKGKKAHILAEINRQLGTNYLYSDELTPFEVLNIENTTFNPPIAEISKKQDKGAFFCFWSISFISILFPCLKPTDLVGNEYIQSLLEVYQDGGYKDRFISTCDYLDQIAVGVDLLEKNEEFKEIFSQILYENSFLPPGLGWGDIALFFSKIELTDDDVSILLNILKTINEAVGVLLSDIDLSFFVSFFISNRIVIERINLKNTHDVDYLLPLKSKDITFASISALYDTLQQFEPEQIISYPNFVPVYNQNPDRHNAPFRETDGRDIIAYFMEKYQIRVPVNYQSSFEDFSFSKAFVNYLAYKLFHQTIKTFMKDKYNDLVPCSSLRTKYLMCLIETLSTKISGRLSSILDPFGGWGGTLLASSLCSSIATIYDNDLNQLVQENKQRLVDFINERLPEKSKKDIRLINKSCSELSTADLAGRQVDAIITSPPFCSYEEYGCVEPDAAKRPSEIDQKNNLALWLDNIVTVWLRNFSDLLREGGVFAVQISNLFHSKDLVSKFLAKVQSTNFFNTTLTQDNNNFDSYPYSRYAKTKSCNYFFVFTKKPILYHEPPVMISEESSISEDEEFMAGVYELVALQKHDRWTMLSSASISKNKESLIGMKRARMLNQF